ncbi:MAG: TetR/AcrR family transcriptional regulator [Ahniella sp.]|nr:TetR/AcrR family transcriptional regulator [Ahniella sp.]
MPSIRPTSLPAEERRAAAVEAMVQLAARQNPVEISTTAIARHMGLTQGALFKHFPTKDALIEAVMDWVATRLIERVDQAAQSKPTSIGSLEAMFMAHVGFVTEHPGVPRILFGELQRAEMTAAKRLAQHLLQRYGELLGQVIEGGKRRGDISPDVATEAAATMFIGTLQGLVMQSLLVGDVTLIRKRAGPVFTLYARAIEVRT